MNTLAANLLPVPHAQPPGPARLSRLGRLAAGLIVLCAPHHPAFAAGDTRQDCMLWNRSSGAERVELGNRIGAENLLTKQHRFATTQPGDTLSLYSTADLRRLCDPR